MMHCRYFYTTGKGNHSATLTPTVVGRRRPIPSELCAQSDPSTLFEKRQLRPISAYNVSTVRDSERNSIMTNIKSTTDFPISCRWSTYVTPKSRKGSSKTDFLPREGGLGSHNSVRPSVTRVHCDKTKWRTADIFIPHVRAINLLLWYEEILVDDASFPLKSALKVIHCDG